MAIFFFESLRLRVKTHAAGLGRSPCAGGVQDCDKIVQAHGSLSIRQNCAWIESFIQSYGDRWGGGLQFVPIGQDGFEVLSDGLAPSPAVVQFRRNQT